MIEHDQLLQEVRAHPLCAALTDDGKQFTVLYDRSHAVAATMRSLSCNYQRRGKSAALRALLDRMKLHVR